MTSIGPELVAELLSLSVYAVGALAFTVLGAFAEYNSLQHLGSGETTLALWFAAIGALLLYAGVYGLGYGKLLARASGR